MKSKPSKPHQISIVVNNYNYGRFLRQCIDSILNQTVPPYEVIVVDDGSTDESGDILREYEDKVKIVLKSNGGQASAMNAGFSMSSGDWIWFVDADDWLAANAIEIVRPLLDGNFTKIQGRLLVYDQARGIIGVVPKNASKPSQWKTRDKLIVEHKFPSIPPTTGNIFQRCFLESIFPIPESIFKICGDEYLNYSGIDQQTVRHTSDIIGYYRSHGNNAYLINTLFCTNKEKLSQRINSLLRQRELIVLQYPTAFNLTVKFPFPIKHLKTLALADRVLLNVKDRLPLSRKDIRSLYRKRIYEKEFYLAALMDWFAYYVICYAPLKLIDHIGAMEVRYRSIKSRFSIRNKPH